LGYASVLGTSLRTRGTWAMPQCWAHPAHTWRLGCGGRALLGTSGGWVMAPDSREMN